MAVLAFQQCKRTSHHYGEKVVDGSTGSKDFQNTAQLEDSESNSGVKECQAQNKNFHKWLIACWSDQKPLQK